MRCINWSEIYIYNSVKIYLFRNYILPSYHIAASMISLFHVLFQPKLGAILKNLVPRYHRQPSYNSKYIFIMTSTFILYLNFNTKSSLSFKKCFHQLKVLFQPFCFLLGQWFQTVESSAHF